MNMELLQNSDVLVRVLLLLLPTVAAFLASVVYLFSAKRTEERSGADSGELGSAVMLFLPICMTNLIYFIMTVILLFINEQITADKITEISIPVYVLISVLDPGIDRVRFSDDKVFGIKPVRMFTAISSGNLSGLCPPPV